MGIKTDQSFKKISLAVAVVASVLSMTGCGKEEQAEKTAESAVTTVTAPMAANVATDRLIAADADPSNWMSTGRTYSEQRFSPLEAINADNVAELGLDWYFDFPTNRGIEATPIVVDGVMYVSGSWSMVFALDAKTGEMLWQYDPQVPPEWAANACCDVVNRGVAVWEGKVFVGTLDGRLVAINAKDGSLAWETMTIDQSKPYTITGAPRIVKGKVMIGNGGAEYGVRGYVSAYDTDSGEMAWRFYTVPGKAEEPFENPVLAKAAETWTGEWWAYGGGGTVWDSMAYDPELDLLYIGVGNGSPWDPAIRSPEGGDNLFLSSIVAIKPDTGEYVWHYQTTPAEAWDYTATQHMILADLNIDGNDRKVIMQAPKNGFFYVIDRETGKLLSAENYTTVTWASHIDLETGRPVELDGARYGDGEVHVVSPPGLGAHSWHPMSYSPDTGYVYIPVQEASFPYQQDVDFETSTERWHTGVNMEIAGLPENDKEIRDMVNPMIKGHIAAWDPIAQKEVWRVQFPNLWNGGMLSTAGNLLFQGNADAEFAAYNATDGARLWSFDAQTGIVAAPITYTVDGEQYIAVAAGWGGVGALATGAILTDAKGAINRSRVLVYKLGAEGQLPDPVPVKRELPTPPVLEASPEELAAGHALFSRHCSMCHGDRAVSASSVPDLRYMAPQTHEHWNDIVIEGILNKRGMVGFASRITPEESSLIHGYVTKRAHDVVNGKD